jgi:hypothetical protein
MMETYREEIKAELDRWEASDRQPPPVARLAKTA